MWRLWIVNHGLSAATAVVPTCYRSEADKGRAPSRSAMPAWGQELASALVASGEAPSSQAVPRLSRFDAASRPRKVSSMLPAKIRGGIRSRLQ